MEGNINEAIEQISEKLGLAITDISQLMPQVVKEQIIFKSIKTGVSIFLVLICIILLAIAYKHLKNFCDSYSVIQEGIEKGIVKDAPKFVYYSDVETDNIGIAFAICGGVGLILFTIIAIVSASDLISWIIAPEANFIKYILSFIK